MKFEHDFLNVMSLDEIRAKVNACHPGSFHKIMILDGAPITLDDDKTMYITETFNVRFNIKYGAMAHVQFKKLVGLAKTPREVATCREVYNKLKHKEIVAKTAVAELEKKERLIASGSVIAEPPVEEEKDEKIRDLICPSIVNCKNGSITLTCYASFRNNIKSIKGGFEYSEIQTQRRFFIRENASGLIYEITPDKTTDEKVKKALETAVATARATAKKKGGGVSSVYTPKVTNILNIW